MAECTARLGVRYEADCLWRPPAFPGGGRHAHDSYEIVHFHSPVTVFIKDTSHTAGSRDLVLVNVHDMHGTIYPSDSSTWRSSVRFSRAFLQDVFESASECLSILSIFRTERGVVRLSDPVLKEVVRIMDRMVREAESPSPHSTSLSRALLAELLITLKRHEAEFGLEDTTNRSPAELLVSMVAGYISANYTEELSLDSLGERFCLSRWHLSHLFKRHTGFTVGQYISHVRVTEAARRLVGSRERVTDVAGQVGFGDINHFTRVFKRIMGLSPREYRIRQSARL